MKFGPLIRSWTLPYEARLKLCKQVIGNFKKHLLFIDETIACDLIELSSMEYPFVLHLYTNAYREDYNTYITRYKNISKMLCW